jgi:hypothetical protein
MDKVQKHNSFNIYVETEEISVMDQHMKRLLMRSVIYDFSMRDTNID